MTTMLRDITGARGTTAWLPWVAAALLALFLVGYVDGTVYGMSVAGTAGLKLNYLHEAVHHARHVFLMCH